LALYQQHLLAKAPDPAAPVDLQGRKINTEHYGTGVGRNVWKNKNVVCLIGDHDLPRNATIAATHGWSGQPLTNSGLRQAEGKRAYGDVFQPEGDYAPVHEGHTLRWMKQASMRGRAREINEDGTCGPRKLVIFTGDVNMVVRNWHRLYPGAPLPRSYVWNTLERPLLGSSIDGSKPNGYEGLAEFLMSSDAALVDGKRIKDAYELPRALNSPACCQIAATYGWSVAKAKEVGQAGRGNWLVNWQRHADQLRRQNTEYVAKMSAA
jgi:hypothetical protein